MTCVCKEYEGKMKIVQEQRLHLKMQSLKKVIFGL